MSPRCIGCGDPAPNGWNHCRSCHAYNDVRVALRHAAIGLDEFRLRRGLRYLHRADRRESVRELVTKLMRRINELENELELR